MQPIKNKSFFARIFPTPKFLTTPAVGIDISDNSVHFIEFKDKHGDRVLNRYGSYVIPNGVISKGEIQNVEALTDILKKLKDKYNIDFVHASLPEEKAYLFKTQIPESVSDKDIRNIIEFKLFFRDRTTHVKRKLFLHLFNCPVGIQHKSSTLFDTFKHIIDIYIA